MWESESKLSGAADENPAYLVKTGSCDWMTWTLMMTRSRVLMMRTMSFISVWRTA